MGPGPWGRLAPATVKYHEDNLRSWIKQPANAWSNLAYVVVGVWLLARFETQDLATPLLLIPVTAILIGVTSLLYHASFSLLFQILDLCSMYLLSSVLIVLSARRVWHLGNGYFYLLYLVLVVTAVTLFLLIRKTSGIIIFGVHILAIIALEFVGLIAGGVPVGYGSFAWMLALFLVALVFWILDYKRVLFTPGNHWIQGHAIWHVLSSFCFVFIYNHYRQFGSVGR